MRIFTSVVLLLLAVVLAAALFVVSGIYNVSATDQHTRVVYWALKTNMRQSVRLRAGNIHVPELTDARLVMRGRTLYAAQCVRCHGAPGVAPEPFALGLDPPPANLAYTAREWPAADMYWTIKSGLKMTGMPAWEYRLADEDLWAVVAYLKRMSYESPQQYATELRDAQRLPAAMPISATEVSSLQGDAERGRKTMQQYVCITCHEIPGEVGATVPVGPPLSKIGTRKFIAGVLPNTQENMVQWLQAPQAVHPGSAMPNLGLTPRDARDVAAYLATVR